MTSRRSFLLGLLLIAAVPAWARYDQGQRIQVTGVVSDAQGQPIPGVRVAFEGTRTYFSIRELRRTADKDVRRVSATTSRRG